MSRTEDFDGASEGHTFDENGRLNARGYYIENRPMSTRDWTDVCGHCGKEVKFDTDSECVHDRWLDFECMANPYGTQHELSG